MAKHFKKLIGALSLLLLVGTAGSSLAAADSGVTQSYNAGPSVLSGMIVELSPKDSSSVVPLTNQDIQKMLGVVVPVNEAAIVLTPPSVSSQQVLVATAGRYNMLVSNQNGPIKTGDYLTISALAGIGMKAGSAEPEVVGRAAGSFNGTSNVVSSVALKGGGTANLGFIPMDIHLAGNPLFQSSNGDLPGFLTSAAKGVANKTVSAPRIYLSALVLLATLLVTGSMFYSAVRNGMVSIGRNPLSRKSIVRGLFQAMIAGLIVFAAGILAVYLILKL